MLKIIHFYHFDPDPRFSPFSLYVRWKSGVTFVRRCFRDVCLAEAHNRTEVGFEQPTFNSGARHSPTEPPRSPHPKIEKIPPIYKPGDEKTNVLHMRKNKDADQLCGNREADQRLCFRYIDNTIHLLSKSEISSL